MIDVEKIKKAKGYEYMGNNQGVLCVLVPIEENKENNKKLKAFEIIKKKNVSMPLIKNAIDLENYNKELRCFRFKKQCLKEQLTQEEYDLLKEVLL